jgi:deoxyribonuclease-4
MITIGRHLSIPDNYKNKKLGLKIYKILDNYFHTKIKRKCINKTFYPKSVQISIGPNTKLSGKNINDYMTKKTIKDIKHLCTVHHRALIIHASYAITLTKPVDKNKPVINTLVRELRNGVLLGAKGVVVHLGSRRIKSLGITYSEDDALNNVIKSVKKVLSLYKEKYGHKLRGTKLLLETPAGQGLSVASKLDNYISLFKRLKDKSVGVCIDTCHIFAAGMVDMRKSRDVLKFWNKIINKIGLNRIGSIHLNDSAVEYNSHRDYHKEIGCGYIGNRKLGGSLDGFQLLLSKIKSMDINLPVIMETPTGIDCEQINPSKVKILTGKITKKSKDEIGTVVELSDLKFIKLREVPAVYYTLVNYC